MGVGTAATWPTPRHRSQSREVQMGVGTAATWGCSASERPLGQGVSGRARKGGRRISRAEAAGRGLAQKEFLPGVPNSPREWGVKPHGTDKDEGRDVWLSAR